MPFYAVAKGRRAGVFTTWAECEQQVKKFSGAIYKKFPSLSEATDYLLKHESIILHQNHEETSNKGWAQGSIKPTGLVMNIKQEEPDYIPLQTTVTQNIKEEPMDNSMCFEDAAGDKELLEALGELKEYPDVNSKPIKTWGGKIKQDSSGNIKTLKIGSYVYSVDKDGYVDVYVGGNSENVGHWNCMAGYGIYFGKDHPLNVAEAASGRMTRNVGDIEAAIAAIEIAQRVGIPKICLHTSSEFLLNAVAFWMNNWKRNGWRNKNGKVVQNRKQFEKLDALLNNTSIDIKWSDARKESGASKYMHDVKNLARIGTEDYLINHPCKDDSFSLDESDYFDYY